MKAQAWLAHSKAFGAHSKVLGLIEYSIDEQGLGGGN
jgi:hypothetical protein